MPTITVQRVQPDTQRLSITQRVRFLSLLTPSLPTLVMSRSASKRGFAANIGIYRGPTHLSWNEFRAAFEASLDAMVRTPVMQRSQVKIEMMTYTDSLNEHVKTAGFPPQQRCMMITTQTETHDDFSALMRDPEMAAEFKRAGEFGLLDGASALSVDVVPKAHAGSSEPEATMGKSVHAIGIHKVPPHLSKEQYTQKFHAFVDKLVAVPVAHSSSMNWCVAKHCSRTLPFLQCLRDEEFRRLMLDAGKDLDSPRRPRCSTWTSW
ncbi:hypothetical protein B0H16DRAFT_1623129 [Mycena metata]|uniref:Uncharacterized protein n=1 Tax=Mycena metata TaxID=1033252 RepID=A0AAD7H5N8_9AGAR|nr:hypothetical protein B0H16DRAFT_1623129 [Mycena metata]